MIIDASVAFKWLVQEPDSHLAIGWIGKADLRAPALLYSEVANALWKSIKRNELPGDDETFEMLGRFGALISVIDERPVMARALAIATQLDHAIYDCIYLALAESEQEELLTADAKFIRKAEAAGYGRLLRMLEHS